MLYQSKFDSALNGKTRKFYEATSELAKIDSSNSPTTVPQ